MWRVYEDVCIICAGLWIGSWRGNSPSSYSTANGSANWGSVRDDDLTFTAINESDHVRSLGLGIEGRPSGSSSNKSMRRSSGMSSSNESSSGSIPDRQRQPGDRDEAVCTNGQLLKTLALLQTFHAHTSFQVSMLETFLPPLQDRPNSVVQLTPRDV